MLRIFTSFARITNRSISAGKGSQIDYTADVIFDNHSEFNFDLIDFEYCGLHVRRDPRDVIVSSGFYHLKPSEDWLHVSRDEFNGQTYRQKVESLESIEDVFSFEMDHAAGQTIQDMTTWSDDPNFLEFKFEDLVSEEASNHFRSNIDSWPLSKVEKYLLLNLFEHFSIRNRSNKQDQHVRNTESQQYKKYFNDDLNAEFNKRFPAALNKLGYF